MADTQVDAGTEISAKVGTLPSHLPTCGNASFRTHCRRFTQVEPEAVDRSIGLRVMDRPMRGGFSDYLLCIVSLYSSCESVRKEKIKVHVRKEKRMCCTERRRAPSDSHCPKRLRGFFVYTGGSVPFAGAHSPISNRTVPEPFFPSHLPPRRLLASSTPRVFCCALTASVRLFVTLRASVRSAGHRRAKPNLFPQTNLSEPFCSGPVGTVRGRKASCILFGPFGDV